MDRPLLAKNVAPANESVLTNRIGSHNESPQVPHGVYRIEVGDYLLGYLGTKKRIAPAYIFFYAHRAPEKGV